MPLEVKIHRISDASDQIKNILVQKGISVPEGTKIDELPVLLAPLADVSGDSVAPESLAAGVTAHDKTGTPITGTAKKCYVGTSDPTASIGADGDIYIKKG